MANGKPNRPLRPRGGSGPGNRRRRVVIDNQAARPRDPRQGGRGRDDTPRRDSTRAPAPPPTGPVSVESGVSVRDFSQTLGVPMQNIIKSLMGLGVMKTATQTLSDEEVELIAAELQREVTIKHAADEDEEPETFEDAEETLQARPPVVTIMGHVDHGKTTLLDAIRNAKVVDTEAGGITQHIGAYQVDVGGRKVTFLDTPGHEAFTAMRARGAKITDIAVLVVAADDSVMPQTRESISHARAAEVPMVVAVNKVDLPDANPDRVLADLSADGLQPEEWGGATQVARVSAKQQTGLDDLLERILLVADAELDLRANPDAEASGPIIESRLDIGRGTVATMLVQRGTLKVGDAIVAGDAWGKVRALNNYKGEKLPSAGPGDPVEILGFDRPPPAGELARVVENERVARDFAKKRAERLRREQLAQQRPAGISLENLFEQALVGMRSAVKTEETIGEAEVRNTFKASRVGTIAGCMVTNGVLRRGAQVRVIRDSTVIYTTTIDSLKRFQDDAREVAEGFECGLHLANFDDVKVGDVLEAFETREVERTSLDEPPSAA